MTSLSARRVAACIASAAALAAVAPATASATTTDRGEACSGTNILGRGSTFQNPEQKVWEGAIPGKGFNVNKKDGCSGREGSGGKPTATYLQGEEEKGSGACQKAFGSEKKIKNTEVNYCGTDEAPTALQKREMEEQLTGTSLGSSPFLANEEDEGWLETIPVTQGAEAMIVNLPEHCTASSEPAAHRLALDNSTVEAIYRGTITTWKQVLEHQAAGHGNDALSCASESEKEDVIKVWVRKDHSGTTHIFKAYLAQVSKKPFEAEGSYDECASKAEHEKGEGEKGVEGGITWFQTSTGCENQRWPAAHSTEAPTYEGIHRGLITGNPGVVEGVANNPSSIGYADLAVAREYNYFSAKCTVHPTACGGENPGEPAQERFWAVLQKTSHPAVSYSDPSTTGDTEAESSSNCKKDVYINTNGSGEEFPPATTRDVWSGATAAYEEKKGYAICGLTYDLAWKFYYPFFQGAKTEPEGIALATTVENYLYYETGKKGGAKEAVGTDYEALPKSILAKAAAGIEEIGYKVSS